MGQQADVSVLDALLDQVINNAVKLVITAGEPASFTDADNLPTDGTPGLKLAEVAINAASFTKAAGDVSGRKATLAAQTGVAILATGDGDHVNMISGDTVLRSHPFTQKSVAIGDQIDVAAFFFDVLDPSSA